MSMRSAHQAFHDQLVAYLPTIKIYTDPLSTLAYGTDASFYRLRPQIVVRVESEQEAAANMAYL